jgi:ribosomal protein S18 acetylase RimI-like enzyme
MFGGQANYSGLKTMPSELSSLTRLEEGQIKPASQVLARAFLDDPGIIQFVTEPGRRQELLRSMFSTVLSQAVGHGEVYATSPAMEGIAIWLPSGIPDITFWEALRGGGLSLIFKGGWEFMRKMKQDGDFIKSLRQRLAPTPHWYLAVLGVAPEFQGKGCASRLLRPMLARLDAEKLPAYLETSTEDYAPMYRHFGFRVVQEAVLPGSGSKIWAMLREND